MRLNTRDHFHARFTLSHRIEKEKKQKENRDFVKLTRHALLEIIIIGWNGKKKLRLSRNAYAKCE